MITARRDSLNDRSKGPGPFRAAAIRVRCGPPPNNEETSVRKFIRRRCWFEITCAVLALALALVTLIDAEWIEEIFGVDPDNGSGALEWLIVAVLAVATVTFSLMARAEWRKTATAS